MLMRYYSDFIIYSRKEFDVIIKLKGFNNFSGERSVIERFSKYIDVIEKRYMYFAKLDENNELYDDELSQNAVKTKFEDAPDIWGLHRIINGGQNLHCLDILEKKFIDKSGRGYHLVNAHNITISSVETTAENSNSAMIVGVCTHPDYRRLGYTSALVSRLCMDLLLEGKTSCLFYDNPIAGKIYKNLGFNDIGYWCLWKNIQD